MSKYVLNKLPAKKRISALGLAGILLLGMFMPSILPAKEAQALSGSQFTPGRIIDDAVFYNKSAMSATQIQTFLNSKVPVCDTNHAKSSSPNDSGPPYTCLKSYKQNTASIAPESGICNGYTGRNGETAAQIIYKVAQSCGINPQVILVMLQKEQGLVTDTWPWRIQYQKAMGAFCPDSAPCNPAYAGFFYQVYYGAHRFKIYAANPDSYNYKAGRNNSVLWHPNTNCGRSTIYIQNQATASLYIYTPYRPNKAALNNLYGTGDACSSYGNRNFWRMFTDWFGSTTRSVLFRINGSGSYYLEWGDYYYPITSTEMLNAYGLASIAPRSLAGFPAGKTRGPALQRNAKFGSDNPSDPDYTAQVDIVDNGKRHAVPNSAMLTAHGYAGYETYDQTLSFLIKIGDPLRHVVRRPDGGIFLLQTNKRRVFPDNETYSTLSGPNVNGNVQVYSGQLVTNMSSTYINGKPEGAPMLLDGKIFAVSGSPGIYLHEGGQKHPFSADSYYASGGRYDYKFSQTSTNQITNGTEVPVFLKSSTNQAYLINDGKKHLFDAGMMTDWAITIGQFRAVTDRTLARFASGGSVPMLVTDGRPGVYFIHDGEKHGIPSSSDFSKLGFKWNNVKRLSKSAFNSMPRGADLYAPGSLVRTPNGAVFAINDNYTALGVPSGQVFTHFGFSWSKVLNVTEVGLAGYTQETLNTFIHAPSYGKYYIVDSGKRHYISNTLLGATQYNLTLSEANDVHTDVAKSVKLGSDMTRFVKGSSATIYYIENGEKRPLSSQQSFRNKGGSWDDVVTLSNQFLSTIPTGSAL